MYLLQTTIYESEDPLHQSDQISVSPDIWSEIYETSMTPLRNNMQIFFSVHDGEVIGRIRPDTALRGTDSIRIPLWMWMRLGAPDPDYWVSCSVMQAIPKAGKIVLRARVEATLTAVDNPVEMLTMALSGQGANPSWACLNMGSELPLSCGVFDVMDMIDVDGNHISYGSILDTDVDLELIPALDHIDPPPPTPSFHQHTPSFSGSGEGRLSDVSAGTLSSPILEPAATSRPVPPLHRELQRRGMMPSRRPPRVTPFTAFACAGRRLCDGS